VRTVPPLPWMRVVLIGTISGVSAAFLAVALVSLAVRYGAGGPLLRQQVKWLGLAAVAFVICQAIALLLTGASPSWLTGIAYTLVAVIVLSGIPAAIASVAAGTEPPQVTGLPVARSNARSPTAPLVLPQGSCRGPLGTATAHEGPAATGAAETRRARCRW
jgi:hypothetical protein